VKATLPFDHPAGGNRGLNTDEQPADGVFAAEPCSQQYHQGTEGSQQCGQRRGEKLPQQERAANLINVICWIEEPLGRAQRLRSSLLVALRGHPDTSGACHQDR